MLSIASGRYRSRFRIGRPLKRAIGTEPRAVARGMQPLMLRIASGRYRSRFRIGRPLKRAWVKIMNAIRGRRAKALTAGYCL